jgi:hypothetical protein
MIGPRLLTTSLLCAGTSIPGVFAYYEADRSNPSTRPSFVFLVSDSLLAQPILGYVLVDDRFFQSDFRMSPKKALAHVERTVECPQRPPLRELLRSTSW